MTAVTWTVQATKWDGYKYVNDGDPVVYTGMLMGWTSIYNHTHGIVMSKGDFIEVAIEELHPA